MKVLAILLVIGVSWVAAHPGLFDWHDNANKLIGGFAKNTDDEDSVGAKKGLLGPVKGILENVNSWGSKLIPAPIRENEILGKMDVLKLWNKGGDEGIVKEAVSPLANIFGEENLVGSIISSAVGTIKENVLGDVVDKFTGGFGGGKKLKSNRKSNYQKSSELREKESESEKESSASSKSESHKVGEVDKIDEKIVEESDSEDKEKSSEKEIEQKSEEKSSEVEEVGGEGD